MIDTPFYPTQCTFMLENTNGVFIIVSIPHCPSDLQLCQQDSVEYYRLYILHSIQLSVRLCDFKRDKNQEMWLRFYIEDE